jgi:two-component system sensor histidine kinase KdpD
MEAAERLVVGVSGGAGDELVVRRAGALARASGASLLALHVVGPNPHRGTRSDLSAVRSQVASLGGSFHELADEDLRRGVVEFARAQGATQLVLGMGSSRSSRRRGLAARILASRSGVDLIVVSHEEIAAGGRTRRRRPTLRLHRRLAGAALAAFLLPLMTVGLSTLHVQAPLPIVFPCYLIAVVGITWLGGWAVGVISAVIATLLENYYFVAPTHTLSVYRSADGIALLVFLLFSLGASALAGAFARRSEQASRARAEAQILIRAAATVAVSPEDLLPVLDSLRTVLDLDRLAVEHRGPDGWHEELVVGLARTPNPPTSRIAVGEDRRLEVAGGPLDHEDHLMITAFTNRLAEAYRAQALHQEATALQALAEVDELRTGLLRAVSHDLRTPLAAVRANVSSLLLDDVKWPAADQRAILSSIDREVQRLSQLITDLLDAGRLEAGVVEPRIAEVALDDLLAGALETIDLQGRHLDIQLDPDLPVLRTDPDLVERAIANIVANACTFSPLEQPVRIRAAVAPGRIDVVISDQGPGIAASDRARAVLPFQRLADSGAGSGLGLSVAEGFITVLGGSLHLDQTPGGGLTVVLEIPSSPRA